MAGEDFRRFLGSGEMPSHPHLITTGGITVLGILEWELKGISEIDR